MTTTGASGFKDEIESATMSTFKDDVKAYNNWFDDKKKPSSRRKERASTTSTPDPFLRHI